MDYPENRLKYYRKFPEYLQKIKLTKELMALVKEYYPGLWATDEIPSDDAIKAYILLELTVSRYSCSQIIKFLNKSENSINVELATGLQLFNTSPGRHSYGDQIEIPVIPVQSNKIFGPTSRTYSMTKNPRGKAIIINVVPKEVLFEAQRFAHIFGQFNFDVRVRPPLTTNQMKAELDVIREEIMANSDDPEKAAEALIVMIITHGSDEEICGKDHPACSNILPGDPGYNQAIFDCTPKSDIVDIFAPTDNLDMVKLFFFTCCRGVEKSLLPLDKNCALANGTDTHNDTHIVNSCAEGYATFYDPSYTPFGRLLSESFAQYAHNEHLAQIINRTNHALRERGFKGGDYAPDNNPKNVRKDLYFNPGWFDNESELI